MGEETTHRAEGGVTKLDRREHCSWHDFNSSSIQDHEVRLRVNERDIALLLAQTQIQNDLLEKLEGTQRLNFDKMEKVHLENHTELSKTVNREFHLLNNKILVGAVGVAIYLLNQLLPYMLGVG